MALKVLRELMHAADPDRCTYIFHRDGDLPTDCSGCSTSILEPIVRKPLVADY